MVLDEHGDVMSKSKGNVISPEDMIAGYGCDAVRAYILFMAPPDKELQWNEDGLAGMHKFLNRVWRMVNDLAGAADEDTLFQPGASDADAAAARKVLLRERHRVAGKVVDDFDHNNFNTAIAAIMELANAAGDYLRKVGPEQRAASADEQAFATEIAEVLVKLLAPICPHMTEELWHDVLGHEGSIHTEEWPEFDSEKAKDDEVELAVQVNGKVKARITVAADAAEDDVKAVALEAVKAAVETGPEEGHRRSRTLGEHRREVAVSPYGAQTRCRRNAAPRFFVGSVEPISAPRHVPLTMRCRKWGARYPFVLEAFLFAISTLG